TPVSAPGPGRGGGASSPATPSPPRTGVRVGATCGCARSTRPAWASTPDRRRRSWPRASVAASPGSRGGPMPRDPNIPDECDVYTLVILRRADDAPEISDDDLSELQTRHLAYRGGLAREGVLVVNGPFDEQGDTSYRGMSIFACDLDEAARLSDGDPSVIAGRLTYDAMKWWVRAGSLEFPLSDRPV